MAIRKRYVHQWYVPGRPDDGRERIWTEINMAYPDLLELIGLAPNSMLIGLHVDHAMNVTITAEEPREALCQSPASDGSSAGASRSGSASA